MAADSNSFGMFEMRELVDALIDLIGGDDARRDACVRSEAQDAYESEKPHADGCREGNRRVTGDDKPVLPREEDAEAEEHEEACALLEMQMGRPDGAVTEKVLVKRMHDVAIAIGVMDGAVTGLSACDSASDRHASRLIRVIAAAEDTLMDMVGDHFVWSAS